MTSPIFFPFFVKRYIIQARSKTGAWQNQKTTNDLAEAEKMARTLHRQNPGSPIRIFNRFTQQVVKSYPANYEKR